MNMRKWLLMALAVSIAMGGCAKENGVKQQSMQGTNLIHTNTDGTAKRTNIDQRPAERAVAYVRSRDDIKDAVAVNTSKKLLVAYQIKHMNRFYRKQIEKEIHDQLKHLFPDYQIVSSSDLKIFWKTKELVDNLENKKWDETKANKQIEKIKRLSEDSA
ncbi:YhcN/YlaJ family sporulation lipoprotein [Saccharococcus thermophilus]|nr:YhcN/YlaJ family sporulation lipoprotein [Saccharococcus thermophilus]